MAGVDQSPIDLLERTWHYDCIVKPTHAHAVSTTHQSSILNYRSLVLAARDQEEKPSTRRASSKSAPINVQDDKSAMWQKSLPSNGSNKIAVEEETTEEQRMTLRRVSILLPDNLSEINGYVSLSSYISTSSESPHGGGLHGGFDSSPLALESKVHQETMSNFIATCRQEEKRSYNNTSRNFFNTSRFSSFWLAIHN